MLLRLAIKTDADSMRRHELIKWNPTRKKILRLESFHYSNKQQLLIICLVTARVGIYSVDSNHGMFRHKHGAAISHRSTLRLTTEHDNLFLFEQEAECVWSTAQDLFIYLFWWPIVSL